MTGPELTCSGGVMWHVMLFNTLLFIVCTYALWRGGMPERLCAIFLFVACLLTFAAAPALHWSASSVEWGVFVVDVALLIGFLVLALHANRFWPMWATATHSLAVLAHVSKVLAPEISPLFYATLAMGSAWPLLALIALGTYRHQQRVSAGLPDPDWTDFRQVTGGRTVEA